MGLHLQLGRQAPIPQNGLCFHPKNTANTHTSDPEMSCVNLGWRDAGFGSEGTWEGTSAEGCLMGTGVGSLPGGV